MLSLDKDDREVAGTEIFGSDIELEEPQSAIDDHIEVYGIRPGTVRLELVEWLDWENGRGVVLAERDVTADA
jgi:hypothetical protein